MMKVFILCLLIVFLAGCVPAGATPTPLPFPAPTIIPISPTYTPEPIMTEDDRSPYFKSLTVGWQTDWTRHLVEYDEILSGGPPRDGIPSIDDPQFVDPAGAEAWLADNEPVIALILNDEARAYPLQILTYHEIVNDVVGGVPVMVTFCPLCNSAIVFERQLDGQVFDFGTSGLLRNSDLIMYDRTTESLWQQFTGQAIVGELTGRTLTFLPSAIVSFGDFRAAYPAGQILGRETGYDRPYGTNPYIGYDTIDQNPFLFDGPLDGRLPAMARVVTISSADLDLAYPLTILAEMGVINDRPGNHDLVLFYQPGTSTALGSRLIADGEDVGATAVFDPNLDGQRLTFVWQDGQIVDEQTGSRWNIFGQATHGPLSGRDLTPIVHGDHFWFSWAAFRPLTQIYEP